MGSKNEDSTKKLAKENSNLKILTNLAFLWVSVNLISYILILIRVFYLPDAPPLSQHWSFFYNDKPWTPNNIEIFPIVGNHYFGDFQLGLTYSSLENPFKENQLLPYGYPPLIHQVFKFLSQFNTRLIFFGYLLLQLFLIYTFIKTLAKDIKIEYRQLFKFVSIVVSGFSIPLAVGLDRGNFVVPTITISAIALQLALNPRAHRRGNSLLPALLFALALNLKAYVGVIVLILFFMQKKMIVILTLIFAILPNLIISFLYPGGPLKIIYIYIKSLLFYSDNPDPLFALSGNSQIAGIGRTLQLILNVDPNSFILNVSKYSLIFGFIWLATIMYLVLLTNIPNSLKTILILTNLQFFAPVSMFYTGLWSLFALIIIIQYLFLGLASNAEQNHTKWQFQIYSFGLASIVSIAPNPTRFYFILTNIPWMIIVYGIMLKSLTDRLLQFRSGRL